MEVKNSWKSGIFGVLAGLLTAVSALAQTASLLPNGQQVFLDSNGAPLAGGLVYMYVPNTTTPKVTWQDPGEVTPNSNPVVLNSAGRALIYGTGQYRQILTDSDGNTIWDQLTADALGTAISPAMSPVVSAASLAAARTALGLGTLAVQNASSVAITGGSIVGITDLAVADGGTGTGSLTASAVLLGNGTLSVKATQPLTAGYVLTSNGVGSDPTFQAATGSSSVFTAKFTSGQQVIPIAGSTLTVAHALGAVPFGTYTLYHNISPDCEYNIGDEPAQAPVGIDQNGGTSTGLGVYSDTTNVYLVMPAQQLTVLGKADGVTCNMISAKWTLIVKAWL